MKKPYIKLIINKFKIALPLVAGCANLNAAVVTFDFEGQTGGDLDGLTSGLSLVDSYQMNAVTSVGKFNRTNSGFGIDSPGSDDSDAFDGIFSPESISFSFESSGKLTSIEFDRFTNSANDAFSLSYAGNPPVSYNKSDLGSGNLLLLDWDFSPGENFNLSFESGNGFGLETMSAEMTPVPEPSEYALISAGCLVAFALSRKKTKRKNFKNPCKGLNRSPWWTPRFLQ